MVWAAEVTLIPESPLRFSFLTRVLMLPRLRPDRIGATDGQALWSWVKVYVSLAYTWGDGVWAAGRNGQRAIRSKSGHPHAFSLRAFRFYPCRRLSIFSTNSQTHHMISNSTPALGCQTELDEVLPKGSPVEGPNKSQFRQLALGCLPSLALTCSLRTLPSMTSTHPHPEL